MDDWRSRQIVALEEAWEEYWPLIQSLDEQEFDKRLPEGRSVKEVLAHVAFWEEAAVGFVRLAIRHEPVALSDWYGGVGLDWTEGDPWPDAATHNAREAKWAAGQTPSNVLQRVHNGRLRLLELLASLTDEELSGELRDYFGNERLPRHFREHLAEIGESVSGGSDGIAT